MSDDSEQKQPPKKKTRKLTVKEEKLVKEVYVKNNTKSGGFLAAGYKAKDMQYAGKKAWEVFQRPAVKAYISDIMAELYPDAPRVIAGGINAAINDAVNLPMDPNDRLDALTKAVKLIGMESPKQSISKNLNASVRLKLPGEENSAQSVDFTEVVEGGAGEGGEEPQG